MELSNPSTVGTKATVPTAHDAANVSESVRRMHRPSTNTRDVGPRKQDRAVIVGVRWIKEPKARTAACCLDNGSIVRSMDNLVAVHALYRVLAEILE